MLDLSWHSLEAGEHITDVLSFESEVLAAAGFSRLVPPRYRSTYFGHIFASGYASGYYSYLYSEVIAAWVSEWFDEQGGLSREAGDAFREAILAPGYSVDPMSAIERFFGTRPDVGPLLRRRGLAEPVTEAEAEAETEVEAEGTEADANAEAGAGTGASLGAESVGESDPAEEVTAESGPGAASSSGETKIHPNHEAVAADLVAAGIEPRIEIFTESTPTAATAAEALGIEVGAIANSLIFSAAGSPVLISWPREPTASTPRMWRHSSESTRSTGRARNSSVRRPVTSSAVSPPAVIRARFPLSSMSRSRIILFSGPARGRRIR